MDGGSPVYVSLPSNKPARMCKLASHVLGSVHHQGAVSLYVHLHVLFHHTWKPTFFGWLMKVQHVENDTPWARSALSTVRSWWLIQLTIDESPYRRTWGGSSKRCCEPWWYFCCSCGKRGGLTKWTSWRLLSFSIFFRIPALQLSAVQLAPLTYVAL